MIKRYDRVWYDTATGGLTNIAQATSPVGVALDTCKEGETVPVLSAYSDYTKPRTTASQLWALAGLVLAVILFILMAGSIHGAAPPADLPPVVPLPEMKLRPISHLPVYDVVPYKFKMPKEVGREYGVEFKVDLPSPGPAKANVAEVFLTDECSLDWRLVSALNKDFDQKQPPDPDGCVATWDDYCRPDSQTLFIMAEKGARGSHITIRCLIAPRQENPDWVSFIKEIKRTGICYKPLN